MQTQISDALNNLIENTSPKNTNIGAVDGVRSFKSYYRMIFFTVLLVHFGFFFVTIFQLLFPTVSVVNSLALDVIFFALVIIIMVVSDIFSNTDTTFGTVITWMFSIAIIVTLMVAVFFQSTEIHFWTMFVVHLIINVPTLIILIIDYSGKYKFQKLRLVSQKWVLIIICGLFVLLQERVLDFSPSIRVLPGIGIFLMIFPIYLNSVVEINEGITGTYDKMSVIEAVTILALTTASAYIIVMGCFGTIKVDGLDIYLINPFTSSLWSAITFPSSWFSFL